MKRGKPKPKRKAAMGARREVIDPVTQQPVTKELQLAYARVNGSPTRRLRWLLNFAELELADLSEGRLADLRWELVVFGLNKKPSQMAKDRKSHREFSTLMQASPEEFYGPSSNKGIQPAAMRRFHAFMRDAFETLFKGEFWEFHPPQPTKLIAIPHLVGSLTRGNISAFGKADEFLQMRACELIEAEGDRLMICENKRCGKRFVATKKGRARFHSPTCSAYVRIAKSRGKKI
jgi:hypothetical protein